MLIVTNLTDEIILIPPFNALEPREVRRLYGSPPERIDQHVKAKSISIIESSEVASDIVADADNDMFSPEATTRSYTYDGSGNVTKIISTDPWGITREKVYVYDGANNVTQEFPWTKITGGDAPQNIVVPINTSITTDTPLNLGDVAGLDAIPDGNTVTVIVPSNYPVVLSYEGA